MLNVQFIIFYQEPPLMVKIRALRLVEIVYSVKKKKKRTSRRRNNTFAPFKNVIVLKRVVLNFKTVEEEKNSELIRTNTARRPE